VGEAANGREALELVPELEPDVVVMDAMMPVMSGLEATRAIKKRHPHVAVLGFTATPPPHATDLVEAGADAAFDKTDFAKLIATLERWKR
jgi:CheY-like chemotaxis protein